MHSTTVPMRVALLHAGRGIFQEALLDGTMSGFFKLVEQFRCDRLGYSAKVCTWIREPTVVT